jgi:hypothetical protein
MTSPPPPDDDEGGSSGQSVDFDGLTVGLALGALFFMAVILLWPILLSIVWGSPVEPPPSPAPTCGIICQQQAWNPNL